MTQLHQGEISQKELIGLFTVVPGSTGKEDS